MTYKLIWEREQLACECCEYFQGIVKDDNNEVVDQLPVVEIDDYLKDVRGYNRIWAEKLVAYDIDVSSWNIWEWGKFVWVYGPNKGETNAERV